MKVIKLQYASNSSQNRYFFMIISRGKKEKKRQREREMSLPATVFRFRRG